MAQNASQLLHSRAACVVIKVSWVAKASHVQTFVTFNIISINNVRMTSKVTFPSVFPLFSFYICLQIPVEYAVCNISNVQAVRESPSSWYPYRVQNLKSSWRTGYLVKLRNLHKCTWVWGCRLTFKGSVQLIYIVSLKFIEYFHTHTECIFSSDIYWKLSSKCLKSWITVNLTHTPYHAIRNHLNSCSWKKVRDKLIVLFRTMWFNESLTYKRYELKFLV